MELGSNYGLLKDIGLPHIPCYKELQVGPSFYIETIVMLATVPVRLQDHTICHETCLSHNYGI